ncbi:hypothetical protein JQS43_23315 [Natronosporangium hydrolyticum]|uniref:Uncharacterized protein n=1 Tax=Natronosporangium hydrolyticum TaxID=2811111 RepID=A0A895YKL8_9ACTN|nr:hypothetical protein [Natronosporangium hydrolyticum]QSB14388.1 hypothetical protein JQS43_23315 [Natronosporangium hydrolyticum]
MASLVLVVAVTLGAFVTAAGGDESGTSVWEQAAGPLHWFFFVFGVLTTATVFPTYIGFGVTRRRVLQALGIGGGAISVLLALVIAAGYLVEHAILTGRGQEHRLRGDHLFDSVTELHLVMTQYALLTAAFLVAGYLVGVGYYRFGGGRGTLALPLTVAPILVVGVLFSANDLALLLRGPAGGELPSPQLATAVGLSLATLAAAGLGLWLLARRVPIRPRRPA